MELLLSGALGFLSPFFGTAFKLFGSWMDNKHEVEMFRLRMDAASQQFAWKMEEVNAKADIAEAVATHQPLASFGVQLLDKAHASGWPTWMIAPAFYLFVLLDWLTGLVRPTITYVAFGFYIFYRYSCFELAQSVVSKGTSVYQTVAYSWTDNDWIILMMVLTYWLGDRTRQKMFGNVKTAR
jgi:hypothetical protein